jgi:hypothetical protein
MTIRTVDIGDAVQTLAEYTHQLGEGPIVVTSGGQPVAAVVAMEDTDLESLALSMSPQFREIIERSRARGRLEGGVPADEVERRFGHREWPTES